MLYVVPNILLMQCYIVISLINICGGYIYYDNISFCDGIMSVEIFMLICFMMTCKSMW
jgi:hypothetical protein